MQIDWKLIKVANDLYVNANLKKVKLMWWNVIRKWNLQTESIDEFNYLSWKISQNGRSKTSYIGCRLAKARKDKFK